MKWITLDVCGQPIEVHISDAIGSEILGEYNDIEARIILRDGPLKQSTLWHELCHAVVSQYGIDRSLREFVPEDKWHDFEELFVASFGAAIYNTLKQNGLYKEPK